jgi:hypothetical protein
VLVCDWVTLWGWGNPSWQYVSSMLFVTSVACAVGASVLLCPQLIFPSKTWFFGIYLNFQWQKSLKTQYLPHSESKSYQINSIKSCSSRSFQQHQRHILIPPKFFGYDLIEFPMKKSFNIQELLHHKSKSHGTRPMHPSPPCQELSDIKKSTIWSIPVEWIS